MVQVSNQLDRIETGGIHTRTSNTGGTANNANNAGGLPSQPLPNSFEVDMCITVISLWVQQRHGSTFRDEQQNNHAIKPLKCIKNKDYNPKKRRSFCRLRKLCKGLDTAAGLTDDINPTVRQLNTLYGSNQTIRAEILPSQLTRMNHH
jgi:hypothetical protein